MILIISSLNTYTLHKIKFSFTHTHKKKKRKEKKEDTHTQKRKKEKKKVGLWFHNKSSVQYVIMHLQVLER